MTPKALSESDCPDAVRLLREMTVPGTPWLVLGQGPSLERLSRVNLKDYHSLALNRSIVHAEADVAHFIDIRAFDESFDGLWGWSCKVIIPWHPHVKHRATPKTLYDFIAEDERPLLRKLWDTERLFSYNSSTAGALPKNQFVPDVQVNYFSGVAAFSLLAKAGAKEIHTLGLDGGRDYAPCFSKSTLLDNGRKSFDIQFGVIDKICRKAGIRRKAL